MTRSVRLRHHQCKTNRTTYTDTRTASKHADHVFLVATFAERSSCEQDSERIRTRPGEARPAFPHLLCRASHYQPAGLVIVVHGSVSGNCAALSMALRMWRTRLAASRNCGATCHRTGHTTKTARLCSARTIRIGNTKSVSFETTTAASNRPFHASSACARQA